MDADNVGAPVTKQQWDYIHKMGDSLRQSFENVTSVFAPSCISHAVLTKKDWQLVKIDDVSIADALHCWEQKTNRRRLKRLKNNKMFSDAPKNLRKRRKQTVKIHENNANSTSNSTINNPRLQKKRQRNNKKGRRKKGNCFLN